MFLNNDQIRELYDSNINMTLAELARITGKSVPELKFILTCEG
jgi:hypothetical protein